MMIGPESAIAAAAARDPGRRISANSFRLLTARLKNGPASPAVLREVPVDLPFPVAASGAGMRSPTVAVAEIADLPETASPQNITLPVFSPARALATAAAADEPVSTVPPAAVEPADEATADDPLRLEAAEYEPAIPAVPATQAILPQFRPLDWLIPPPAVEHQQGAAPEPEPEAIDEGLVEADLGPLPSRALPGLMPTEAAEQSAAAEPTAGAEEAEDPAIQSEAAVPPETWVEPVSADAPDPAIEVEPQPVQPEELPPPALAEQPALDLPVAAPAAAAPVPETETGEEAKTPSSEMAGRVVDAMIKTIRTAIYAKPSASERADFLRDVASLAKEVEDAGGLSAETSPDQALTAAAAKQAPIISVSPSPLGPIEGSVTEVIAERLGSVPLLKVSTAADKNDPFAQSALPSRLADPKPAETVDADEESGDLALTLLDMMSGGTGSLPHERTLAADTLLRILPRIPVRQLINVVERVAIMESPPALLVAKLIRDSRPEVVGPLLERCSLISDQDLMNAAPDGDNIKLRMVARRRILSTVLSDFLIEVGETGVLLTLIRNPGAALSHDAFFKLAECAAKHHALLAPLATRADLPPPVAFELFWHVPQELRRFIFSRFLTDSEILNKILRITLATHGNVGGDAMGEGKFPARDVMDHAIGLAAAFKREQAAQAFAGMGGIAPETAARILADREGEPLTVLLKALGCSRARFEEAITILQLGESGMIRPDRNPDELQAIFEGLSFNKARILLTYWDWFIRKAGPYAPHN